MSYNKSIVPGILINHKGSLDNFSNYYKNSLSNKDHLYILTEIETEDDRCDHDHLIFYGLTEEQFFSLYRWYIEESIDDGTADIVA